MNALYLIPVAWVLGWIVWFARQDNDWTSEVMFNLTFGLIAWPLIGLAQVVSGEWSRLGR